MLTTSVLIGIIVPFIGTAAGAACVFLMRGQMNGAVQRILTGFAAGVMVAASIWSLLIPAIEEAPGAGFGKVMPAVIGFWLGILFLLLLDHVTPHLHQFSDCPEGPACKLRSTTLLLLAVTIHNIPEGMAIGVVYASVVSGQSALTISGAFALALGIAIQNFPEGAIISMPLHEQGRSKGRAFLGGVLTGAVEPVGALLMLALAEQISSLMPFFLAFAAGAMLYVVVEELIPEMSEGAHTNAGVLAFSVGFSLMMVLDVVLG